jgi:hypothetical protein
LEATFTDPTKFVYGFREFEGSVLTLFLVQNPKRAGFHRSVKYTESARDTFKRVSAGRAIKLMNWALQISTACHLIRGKGANETGNGSFLPQQTG